MKMKISVQWLREWVNPPVDNETLATQLIRAGLEVESRTPVAGSFSGVVAARVAQVAPHPNAERLRVCRVDVGVPELLTIVCGAANVAAEMRVPCALIGAHLPDGTHIMRAKLRGVESHGMLCSAVELGIATNATGLFELPATAPIGVDLREFLRLDDEIFEINLTPNRGDCLSIAGVAREVGVINRQATQPLDCDSVAPRTDSVFPVVVPAASACPHYVGRVIRNLDPKCSTPLWMQERLRRSGVRSLGLLVDVTNYVMLELGQPLHAFDLRQLHGAISVRYAQAGERLTLLDGNSLNLESDSLVIADQSQVLALAGIMGGAASGIAPDTTDIFLESAFFAPEAIRGHARRYGVQTESSYRFERGVDPRIQQRAIERATNLLLNMGGGLPGPIIEVSTAEYFPRREVILLRERRISHLLGIEIAPDTVEDILIRLGMNMQRTSSGWEIIPPSFRFDISREADLIEEIARIYGYQNIPNTHPIITPILTPVTENTLNPHRARNFLTARDYQEIITYSFVDLARQLLLNPEVPPLVLANPLSNDLAAMRTNLWPGLIQTAQYNLHRQQERIRIFEIGRSFVNTAAGLSQTLRLAGFAYGAVYPEQWGITARPVDFFDVKADLVALFADQISAELKFIPKAHPALHPGQSAALIFTDKIIGWFGVLHPQLQEQFDLGNSPAIIFELNFESASGVVPHFQTIAKFPVVRRDLALILKKEIAVADLIECTRNIAGNFLHDLILFDVYTGNEIDPEYKSIALGLILQDPAKALTDTEINGLINSIIQRLVIEFSAILRDK